MTSDEDRLLSGPHQIGATRTIDLEALIAVSHIIGTLMQTSERRMTEPLVDALSKILSGGAFHDAGFEFQLDPRTASDSEMRLELARCMTELRERLRSVSQDGI